MLGNKDCSVCDFFDSENLRKVEIDDKAGICRFNPPTPSANDNQAFWPVVNADD